MILGLTYQEASLINSTKPLSSVLMYLQFESMCNVGNSFSGFPTQRQNKTTYIHEKVDVHLHQLTY